MFTFCGGRYRGRRTLRRTEDVMEDDMEDVSEDGGRCSYTLFSTKSNMTLRNILYI